jgi:hypothetical protein
MRNTDAWGKIPSLHMQIRSERNIYLGESLESVSRNEEKYLRCDVDPRAHELENASIAVSLKRGCKQ